MNGLRALVYLERCNLRNSLRKIITDPKRLILWLFFALWWGFTVFNSLRHKYFSIASLTDPRIAAYGAGAILMLLGLRSALVTQSAKPPGAGTALDAMMLSRTAIAEPLAFSWLYGRRLFLMFWRSLIMLAIAIFFILHTAQLPQLIAVVGVLLLFEASCVPFYLLARVSRSAATVLAIAIALAGLSLVITAALAPNAVSVFGNTALEIWRGDWIAVAVIYAGLAASFLCCLGVGDFYAALYEQATHVQTRRERMRARRLALAGTGPSYSATRSPLRGPYAEIWKQLAYTRRRNGVAITIGILAFGPVLGATAAVFATRYQDDTLAAAILVGILAVCILAQIGISLAPDIGKPLWWIANGSLHARLCAWVVGGVLPVTIILATGAATAGILLHSSGIVAIGVSAGLFAPASMRALAMLTYVLSPSKADQRGPGMIVRLLVLYAAIIITGIVTVAAIIFTRSLALSYSAGLLTFVATGACALLIAARRIDGRGMEIALAEAS